jgi:hypothetical protein
MLIRSKIALITILIMNPGDTNEAPRDIAKAPRALAIIKAVIKAIAPIGNLIGANETIFSIVIKMTVLTRGAKLAILVSKI